MNNLVSKFLIALALPLCVVACMSDSIEDAKHCVEQKLDISVVRVDDVQHRFFAVPQGPFQSESMSLDDVNTCFEKTAWKDKWNISLFSEAKYAGYKDEPEIILHHKDKGWERAYLAELNKEGVFAEPAVRKGARP